MRADLEVVNNILVSVLICLQGLLKNGSKRQTSSKESDKIKKNGQRTDIKYFLLPLSVLCLTA